MTDPPRRDRGSDNDSWARRLRRQAAPLPSRNSSARSSALYGDEALQSHHGFGSLGLRTTSSRFSLNEQFAATRREYEFDYDDTSSVLERGSVASHAPDADDVVVRDTTERVGMLDVTIADSPIQIFGTYYDLLCTPRHPSAESIRHAYIRLLTLLDPDRQPVHLRASAESCLASIQSAYETLLDPCRRLSYDLHIQEGGFLVIGTDHDRQYQSNGYGHAELCRHPHLQTVFSDDPDVWQFGVRFDARQMFSASKHGRYDRVIAPKPLEFEMGHQTSFGLPQLDHQLYTTVVAVQKLLSKHRGRGRIPDCANHRDACRPTPPNRTTLAISTSAYGYLQEILLLPLSLLLDYYQPALPSALTQERAIQLHEGTIRPLVSIKLRHDIPQKRNQSSDLTERISSEAAHNNLEPFTSIELISDVLPAPAVCLRLSQPVLIPHDKLHSLFQIAIKPALWTRHSPRIWLGLQRPTGQGSLSCGWDSGNWLSKTEESCRFPDHSGGQAFSLDLPGLTPPKLELAYSIGSVSRPRKGYLSDRPTEGGLLRLDQGYDSNDQDDSWKIMATAEPNCLNASMAYAHDFSFGFLQQRRDTITPISSRQQTHVRLIRREMRFEAELSSNSFWACSLVLRCLKPIGRFTRLGFEVGLSTYSLHVSLYWSRLGYRINLPFLICTRASFNTRILLWTSLVPFTAFATWDLASNYFRIRRRQRYLEARGHPDVQERKRLEADRITTLLAPGVHNKQRVEQASKGLVILDAKYGVKMQDSGSNAWGVSEVADVTVAISALVDKGRLSIPSGVDKSNILGFWDPAPSEQKVLHVRYSFDGREATAECCGDHEDFVLPPGPSLD